jgi:hypothetical protein
MPASPPTYTPLPTPVPQRSDPANFAVRADLLLTALPTFGGQINALAANVYNNAVEADQDATAADAHRVAAAASAATASAAALTAINAPGTQGTSTTSLAVGTGAKTLTTQTGKAWVLGQWVIVANSAAAANWMLGYITAYNSGTGAMTVEVTSTGGSGTFTTWNIALSAPSSDAVPLAQLLAGLQQALDLAGVAAREVSAGDIAGTALSEILIRHMQYLADIAGVAARAVAGGDVILRLGTVGDPSLRFDADLDTGLYSPGANALGVAIGGQDALRITSDRRLGIGTPTPTGLLDVNDNRVRVRTAKTPANASDTGNAGEICWDASYLYVCTATNTWKRVGIATW